MAYVAFIGLVVALHLGLDILVPVALAILIWFLIDAFANAVARLFGSETAPLALKIFSALAFLGFLRLMGRMLTSNLLRVGGELDPTQSPLIAWLLSSGGKVGLPTEIGLDGLLRLYPLQDLIGAAVAIVRDLVAEASLVFLYVLFLMIDERFFDAMMRALAPDDRRRAALKSQIGRIADEARIYLWLMFLISLGVGAATFAITAAFGLNFIPTIGSILPVAAPAVFALLAFEDPALLAALIGLLAATQFIAGEIAMPRLMGRHLNLSAMMVLLALAVWGALWGPMGMFLGIPIRVIILLICADFPRARFVAILLSRDGCPASGGARV